MTSIYLIQPLLQKKLPSNMPCGPKSERAEGRPGGQHQVQFEDSADQIAARLKSRYSVEMAHLVTKASSGHPVSDSAVQDLKKKVDFVVAGIGD